MKLFYTKDQLTYLSTCLPGDYKLIQSEEYQFDSSADEQEQPIQQSLEINYKSKMIFIFDKLKHNQQFIEIAMRGQYYIILRELELKIQQQEGDLDLEEFSTHIHPIIEQSPQLKLYFDMLVDSVYHADTLKRLLDLNEMHDATLPMVTYAEQWESGTKLNVSERFKVINCVKRLSKRKYKIAFDLLKGKRSQKLRLKLKRIPEATLRKLVKLTGYTAQQVVVQSQTSPAQHEAVGTPHSPSHSSLNKEDKAVESSSQSDSFTSDVDSL